VPPTSLGKESVVIGLNGRKLDYIHPQRRDRHVSLRRRRVSSHRLRSALWLRLVGNRVITGNGRKLDYRHVSLRQAPPLTPDYFNVRLVGAASNC
jgi:hypothetical protein